MRIISGYYKGRKLLSPPAIRPTQDMVRKSMFDILGDIEGLAFLELFAGSGAVGFEALSRGAKPVVFVEQDRQAVKAITLNQESLKAQENSLIIAKDVLQTVAFLHKQGKKFDIVFLDPPYCKDMGGKRNEASASGSAEKMSDSLAKKTLQLLGAYDIVTGCGFILVQHFKKDSLPEAIGDCKLLRQSVYGDTLLSIYSKG